MPLCFAFALMPAFELRLECDETVLKPTVFLEDPERPARNVTVVFFFFS